MDLNVSLLSFIIMSLSSLFTVLLFLTLTSWSSAHLESQGEGPRVAEVEDAG